MGAQPPPPRIPETCNCVSRASVGSLPPRLALVCNVFMYVFVNVIEVSGEWRCSRHSDACCPHSAPCAVAESAPDLLPWAFQSPALAGCPCRVWKDWSRQRGGWGQVPMKNHDLSHLCNHYLRFCPCVITLSLFWRNWSFCHLSFVSHQILIWE